MRAGECLQVLATDPAAKPDFEAMLRHLPHRLVSYQRTESQEDEYKFVDTFLIQKG